MEITAIKLQVVTIPLVRTFKTSLRTVDQIENILISITTDTNLVGFGGAAPVAVITGETVFSIRGAIEHIGHTIIGMNLEESENIFQQLNNCIVGNASAKAAVDMAIYDLLAKKMKVPLYQLLGGMINTVETDITVGMDTLDKMVTESKDKLQAGFNIFKIKVGGDPELEIKRLQAIRNAIGSEARIRIDANQAWKAKEAIYVSKELASRGVNIELLEQPVPARDFDGLRYVRDNVALPVYADESIFSPQDALELVSMSAVDGINIKLMKCGGIYNALKIVAIAETAGVPCMIGSMMESSVSVAAAAHLAASQTIIKSYDLDAPLFCSINPAVGGISYQGSKVCFSNSPGLGIESFSFKGNTF